MMYSASLFCQILALIPRRDFERLVRRTGAEAGSKGFRSWDQFVAMLFCQLAHARSLREIEDGLGVVQGKLNHLGLAKAPSRSTLSYANAHRPWRLYGKLCLEMGELLARQSPGKKPKFHFRHKLLSLDSSTIELCLGLFPWAEFRQTKGAVKLHLLLDHDGYFPSFAVITDGKMADVTVARYLELPRHSIVVMDRGYNDYRLFADWTARDIGFVTRLKDNAQFQIVHEHPVSPEAQAAGVRADQTIRLSSPQAHRDCPTLLRRVVFHEAKQDRELIFLTNKFDLAPEVVADIYKDRWEIELFFKLLKQNLKIKSFVGTSENALQTQIYTALIAIMLIKYLHWKSRHSWSLSNLIALLRWSLFTHRPLWDWLDKPFDTPQEIPDPQPSLPFLDSSRV